jgi:hypothetical protein
MTAGSNIASQRLSNQRITGAVSGNPGDLVAWMGMLQAQDYLGALWAVGLRLQQSTEAAIEQALADATLVRTWPGRGTLHFVAAADVRWMLELLTPRIVAGRAGRVRQLGLDEDTFARSRSLFLQALQGGNRLTRDAAYRLLEAGQISTTGQRGIYILWRLAQEGLICFGPRQGKQQTFVLLSEWLPGAKSMALDQALAELARRYFTSHGPATLTDFAWWSGLNLGEAKKGLEMAKTFLVQEPVNGQAYWSPASPSPVLPAAPLAHLLPAFDEYLVAYKERSSVLDPNYVKQINAGGGMLNPVIVMNGQVMGTWKRRLKKDAVVITPAWFAVPGEAQQQAFAAAAARYGQFLNLPVLLDPGKEMAHKG